MIDTMTTWVNLTPPIVLDAACHPDRVGRVKDRFSVEAGEQASARERSFALLRMTANSERSLASLELTRQH
jgi:hypothetical protein